MPVALSPTVKSEERKLTELPWDKFKLAVDIWMSSSEKHLEAEKKCDSA